MFELDSAIFLWINASASSAAWVLTLARFASETLPQWLVAACAGALLAAGPRVRIAVVRVLLAMVLAWLCARVIKALLPMPRPFMLGLGTAWLPHAGSAIDGIVANLAGVVTTAIEPLQNIDYLDGGTVDITDD